jgi:hypothetical protein
MNLEDSMTEDNCGLKEYKYSGPRNEWNGYWRWVKVGVAGSWREDELMMNREKFARSSRTTACELSMDQPEPNTLLVTSMSTKPANLRDGQHATVPSVQQLQPSYLTSHP